MREITVKVATSRKDLAGVPVGTRILTGNGRVMQLDEIEAGRKNAGATYWIADSTLEPFYEVPGSWLPAMILPPVQE